MMRASPALGALIALGLLLAPDLAQAQTATSTGSADAAAAADRAKSLYREGKFVEALLEFKKAYELQPTPALSYNIARCYEQLSQWEEAIQAYERFMNATSNPRDRSEAADKIEFLKSKVSQDQNSPEARYKARIEGGKKAFSRGDYDAAIQEFKAAFDIKPSAAVLFNIAKSFERMSRYEEAIDYYQQYLDLDPNATDRPDVEEQIRRLKKSIRERFQELSVSSDPPGADIYLDDRNTGLQGQTNFRFKVQPGPHTIFLDANGFEPVKREFVMPDDKPLALEFNMKKLENVGFLEVTVNVDGARIFIDGAIVGLSPYKQKKALTEGAHQITIEAPKYPRYTQDFSIQREQTLALPILLEEYSEPVRDETLEKWGRNLMLIGFIGGGLGFAGPFAYQKLIIRRDLQSYLGPTQVTFGAGVTATHYWTGSPKDASGKIKTAITPADLTDNFRSNGTVGTLETIQTVSVIVGGSLAAVGLGLFVFKWVRPNDTKQVITADLDPDGERPVAASAPVEITSFGVAPTPTGGSVGLTASF
ncbi:MAG: PEGA domain-containing protein [Myxococcota bacterium]